MITSQTAYYGPNGKPTPKGLEAFNGLARRVSDVETLTSVGYTRADAQARIISSSVTRIIVDGLPFVADPSGVALTTGDGRTWSPDGPAEIGHFGGVDGADNTAVFVAIKAYCTATGKAVYLGSGGSYLTDTILLSGAERLILWGDLHDQPEVKLNASQNGHVINTASGSTAVIDLFGVIVDGNRTNQTAGIGIRSAGCLMVRLDQVRIQNTRDRGLGYQEGTTQRTEIGYLEVDTTGADAVGINDLNDANGVFVYQHIKATNYGLDDTTSSALDIYGPADGQLLEHDMVGSCRGLRLRDAGSDGRAATGHHRAIKGTGEGATGGTTIAVLWESSDPMARLGSVHVAGAATPLIQTSTAVGGSIGHLVATGTYSVMALRGAELTIEGGYLEADAAATIDELLELEATTSRNTVRGVTVSDPSNFDRPIKVQGSDNVLDLTVVISTAAIDNGINDLGTNTLLRNPRSF